MWAFFLAAIGRKVVLQYVLQYLVYKPVDRALLWLHSGRWGGRVDHGKAGQAKIEVSIRTAPSCTLLPMLPLPLSGVAGARFCSTKLKFYKGWES